jgi:hypothetical protein
LLGAAQPTKDRCRIKVVVQVLKLVSRCDYAADAGQRRVAETRKKPAS